MGSENGTEVLRISAVTTDPNLSAEICNTMAAVAPGVLERVVKAGSVEVINTAKVPMGPSSPNIIRNTQIGAILGFIGSYAIFLVLYMLDNTVKNVEDLKNHIDVAVLGEIPNFDKCISKGKK
jgi:capsular polysaccharide biosynthesis protein